MQNIQIVVIVKDNQKTQFMQALDVFERWKIVGHAFTVTGVLKDGNTVADGIDKLKVALTKPETSVVAIFAPNIPEGAWYDPAVKVVSDGIQWKTLETILKANGYPGDLLPTAFA